MHNKTPIVDFLIEHSAIEPVSFHMPGHKGADIYKRFGYDEFLSDFPDYDITEIIGADNLFQTEGIIKDVQDKYASLYGVKKSYLLINGTSGGLIASILATVPKGGKIIMARNSHKSVFNALALNDIKPVYVYPSIIEEYNITGAIEASEIARLLDENPDTSSVILPSPNYYGICSDIKAIADEVHKRGKCLIVDQAHGAHLPLFNKYDIGKMPKSAEVSEADIAICSTHKTLASFTQSAILNVISNRVDLFALEDKLQSIESTSPSYILMGSLDINENILREQGETLMREWDENLTYFYNEAEHIDDLKIMKGDLLDRTKINVDFSAIGLNGEDLEKILREEYAIFTELYTGNLLMCMTGIGNTRRDFEKFISALKEISVKHRKLRDSVIINDSIELDNRNLMIKRELHSVPCVREMSLLKDSIGKICASSIIPYPPGIPYICPGEKIEASDVEYLQKLCEGRRKVIGITKEGMIFTGV